VEVKIDMEFLYYVMLALLAGACTPVQAGINSQLKDVTGDAALAALISFAVGTLALLVYVLALRTPWPDGRAIFQIPWWMWTGGCFGAVVVVVSVILAFKLGAVTMLALMVAGQMLASLVLDQYGLVGYPEHPTTIWRFIGAVLVVVGVVLIRRV